LPVNLGSPISTPDNDQFISSYDKGTKAFIYKYDKEQSSRYQIYNVLLNNNFATPKVFVHGKLEFTETVPSAAVAYKVTGKNTNEPVYESVTPEDGNFGFILSPGDYDVNFRYSNDVQANQTITVSEQPSMDELVLASPVWNSKVAKVELPVVVTIPDILFTFDSYSIDASYLPILDSLSNLLKQYDKLTIVVTGHSDSKGKKEYNMKLSEKRANIVRDYFVSHGISSSRITTYARGGSEPVAINTNANGTDNPEGRKYNRRVSIEVVKQNENIQIIHKKTIPEALEVKENQ
jgi:outer membrane protein OmpA-like peptidoglycan-associated protein